MSSSPIPPVPSLQSRHPKDTTKQIELDAANAWISYTNLIPSTCPIEAVTEIITTETAIGKTLLSKHDPAKLQGLYGLMRSTERIHIVEDLRTEVHSRQERAQKWREVMETVAREQSTSEGKAAEAWEPLRTACQDALENTEELQGRLAWCEQNFESGRLTPAVVAERRVWDEGVEIELRGGE